VSRPLAGPRLARVLALVPYVLAHPGTTINELAERFRVHAREIEKDLELLPMCGLPPYTADRLIDVWVTDDGAVDIRLAEYLERPLRLTPAEGVALVAAARALLAVPGAEIDGPLATAVEKLEAVAGVSGRLAVEVGGATHLVAIRDAITKSERIEIDYYSYARDEMTTREVDPVRVFHALGAWYLDGYCLRASADRLFRVDRVRAVRPTGERFEPRPHARTSAPDDAGTDLTGLVYHPRADDRRVTMRLAPAVAWVADELPVESHDVDADGAVTVVLPISQDAFLERLLLRLGRHAEIVDSEVLGLRAAAARRVLDRYESTVR
jgi:proteasome accessory factor C